MIPGPLAIIGGTGHLGLGLTRRLAGKGIGIFIGSRDRVKAQRAAAEIGSPAVRGLANVEAAAAALVIVIAVPFEAHRQTVSGIAGQTAGKVVIDTCVPLVFPGARVERPPAGSLAQEAAQLCPQAGVVAAFHTVSSGMLADLSRPLHGDVLLSGDDANAKETAAELIRAIGMRSVDAGGLEQAHTLEQLAGLLLSLNKRYRRPDLGITIAGLD